MKLTKCEKCGGPTAEGLPLCPDCMRATGVAVDQIAAAEELRDIARVLSITANTYSSRESNILQGTKELIRCRTFNYKGQEMPMLKHLCIGVKRNTALTLRIYFECVQDEEKIVVGWCGEHLPIL